MFRALVKSGQRLAKICTVLALRATRSYHSAFASCASRLRITSRRTTSPDFLEKFDEHYHEACLIAEPPTFALC